MLQDLEELELNLTFEEIKKMTKATFKTISKESIEVNALKNKLG